MAIFRFEAKIISRGGGKSTVASASYRTGGKSVTSAAAYRAGEQLTDERTGKTYDYTAKRGILGAEIMLPTGAPAWMGDRAALWNHIETVVEKRKDAQLAYDYIISIPHELDPEQRIAVVRDFVREQFVDKGLVADVAWHAPSKTELNFHAHVMTSMRRIKGGAFTRTKDRPPAGMHPMIAWQQRLQELRVAWERVANRHLETAGLDIRIDHRSLEERGIQREPETKLGPVAAQREENGLGSHAGDDLRALRARNAEREQLKVELAEAIALEAEIIDFIDARARRAGMEQSPEELARERQQLIEDAVATLRQQERAAEEQLALEARQQLERIGRLKAEFQQFSDEAVKRLDEAMSDAERRRLDGRIASAETRYAIAVGETVTADPYTSFIRAAGAESAAFLRAQEQMRQQLADPKVTGPERQEIILRKEIEYLEYRAITNDRLAGLDRVIGGRRHLSQANVKEWNAGEDEQKALNLREERRELLKQNTTEKNGDTAMVAMVDAGTAGKTQARDRRETADEMDERHVHERQRMMGTAAPPTQEMPTEQEQRQEKERDQRTRYEAGKTPDRRARDSAAPIRQGTSEKPAANPIQRSADPSPGGENRSLDAAQRNQLEQSAATRRRYDDYRAAKVRDRDAEPRETTDRSTARAAAASDSELSDAQREKLAKNQETRALYAEYHANKARERGGGGRSR